MGGGGTMEMGTSISVAYSLNKCDKAVENRLIDFFEELCEQSSNKQSNHAINIKVVWVDTK